MSIRYSVWIGSILATHAAMGQADTAYVATYEKKMMLAGFVANNSIQVQAGDKQYSPNNPMSVGAGFLLHHTVLNLRFGYGFIPIKGKEYGKTRSVDFQVHRYGRRFLLDLFYREYNGYYREEKEIITLYPNLSVRQIGAEGTYIFNRRRFSAKAAFEQSEKQVRSAGSPLLGGGMYWHEIELDKNMPLPEHDPIDNFQLGLNAGYAYSWVIGRHWLLSGAATVGANFGNEPELLKDGKIKVYPTVFARGVASYHRSDWALSLSLLIHNKSVYLRDGDMLSLTSLNVQLGYVKHFDSFTKKKKRF